jgi:hypothetical protein
MATKNGGPRPGAGRKPKADKYVADINKAEKKIRDKLPDIVDAQIGLALGVVVKEFNPITQEDYFYKTVPDRAAGQYLMNRIMGAPLQKIAPTSPDGKEPYDNTGNSALAELHSRLDKILDKEGTGEAS